jgi:hypothetical protein
MLDFICSFAVSLGEEVFGFHALNVTTIACKNIAKDKVTWNMIGRFFFYIGTARFMVCFGYMSSVTRDNVS